MEPSQSEDNSQEVESSQVPAQDDGEDNYQRFVDQRNLMSDNYTDEQRETARGRDVMRARLIELVREHPVLFDREIYVFRKTKVQQKVWLKIAEELGLTREYL